jgi:hypothetical protein
MKEKKLKEWLSKNEIKETIWESLCKWAYSMSKEEYEKEYPNQPLELTEEIVKDCGGTRDIHERLLHLHFFF